MHLSSVLGQTELCHELSAPKSRDSLRLRRRFLPLRKKRCVFSSFRGLHAGLAPVLPDSSSRRIILQIPQFLCFRGPKIPGKIAYSGATSLANSAVLCLNDPGKITVSGATRANLLGNAAVLCFTGPKLLKNIAFPGATFVDKMAVLALPNQSGLYKNNLPLTTPNP